mgnify:FL=1|jgi:hypothetical protein
MTIAQIIIILIMVESGGDDRAIGDNGLSWGPLQISQAYVDDANQHAGTSFVHADAFDRPKATAMFRAYMDRYATERRLGHTPTLEDICRIHNGGPNGWKRSSTDAYWAKVQEMGARLGIGLGQRLTF